MDMATEEYSPTVLSRQITMWEDGDFKVKVMHGWVEDGIHYSEFWQYHYHTAHTSRRIEKTTSERPHGVVIETEVFDKDPVRGSS